MSETDLVKVLANSLATLIRKMIVDMPFAIILLRVLIYSGLFRWGQIPDLTWPQSVIVALILIMVAT